MIVIDQYLHFNNLILLAGAIVTLVYLQTLHQILLGNCKTRNIHTLDHSMSFLATIHE